MIHQLQFHGACRQPDRAEHDQAQDHRRAPAISLVLPRGFAGAQFHGRTILTSRVCGRLICNLAFATRSTKACEDQ